MRPWLWGGTSSVGWEDSGVHRFVEMCSRQSWAEPQASCRHRGRLIPLILLFPGPPVSVSTRGSIQRLPLPPKREDYVAKARAGARSLLLGATCETSFRTGLGNPWALSPPTAEHLELCRWDLGSGPRPQGPFWLWHLVVYLKCVICLDVFSPSKYIVAFLSDLVFF